MGDGANSLSAAFQLEQDRMNNVFDILSEYRQSIREIQLDILSSSKRYNMRMGALLSKTINFLSNETRRRAEVDALYNAVQYLMSGKIPHFILPHDTLTQAMETVQSHLDSKQPHLTLSRRDYAYYYSEASFKTFRKDNVVMYYF